MAANSTSGVSFSTNGEEPPVSVPTIVDQQEVLFLIAKFLSECTPCTETTRTLQCELANNSLLGTVTSWNGSTAPATMEDWERRHGQVTGSHLLTRLQSTLKAPNMGNSQSLLSESFTPQAGESLEKLGRTMVEKLSQRRKLQAELQELTQKLEQGIIGEDQELLKVTSEKRRVDLIRELKELEIELKELRQHSGVAQLTQRMQLCEQKSYNMRNLGSYISARSARGRIMDHSSQRFIENAKYSHFELQHNILGHRANIFCIVTDKQGKWAATGSDDKLIKIWNLRTGILHATFRGHAEEVCDLRIEAEGKVLASASAKTIRLWEFQSGRQLAIIQRHTEPISMLSFDKEKRILISAGDDGACCIWDLRTLDFGDPSTTFVSPLDQQVALLAQESGTGSMHSRPVADPTTAPGTLVHEAPHLNHAVRSEPRLPRDQFAQEHGTNGPIVVREPVDDSLSSQNLPVPIVLPHVDETVNKPAQINFMDVHPNGKFLVTGCDDGTARVWSISVKADPRCRGTPNATAAPNLVKGSHRDGASRLVSTLRGHVGGIDFVGWSHSGDRVLSLAKDSTVRIWSWDHCGTKNQNNKLEKLFNTPRQIVLNVVGVASAPVRGRRSNARRPTVDSAAWNLDDRFVLTHQSCAPKASEQTTGFWDQQFKVWDSRNGHLIHVLRAHRLMAMSIFAHKSLPHIAITSGHDGQLCVWDIEKGSLVHSSLMVTPSGICRILDCQFIPDENNPHEMVAVDDLGNVLFFGCSKESVYNASPTQQFFQTDYDPLDRDSRGFVVDQTTQRAPHLRPPGPLCNHSMEAYPAQPQSLSLSQFLALERGELRHEEWGRAMVERNFKMRSAYNLALATDEKRQKENVIRFFSETIECQNALISEAREQDGRDLLVRAGQRPNTSGGRHVHLPSRAARVAIQTGAMNRAVEANTGAAGTPAVGLLACEREERSDESESDGGSSDSSDEDEGAENTRGNADIDSSNVMVGERKTRRAAKKAVKMVRKYKDKYYGDAGSGEDDGEYDNVEQVGDESGPESWVPQRKSLRNSVRKSYRFSDEESEEEYISDGDDDDQQVAQKQQANISKHKEKVRKEAKKAAKKLKIRKQKDRSIARIQERMNVVFDRDAFQRTSPANASGNYAPQLADQVVYFVQGHLNYLRHFPSAETPPWQAVRHWNPTTNPVVLCEVTSIEYTFPEHLVPRQTDGKTPIQCVLNLRIEGAGIQTQDGLQWNPQPFSTSGESTKSCSFTLHYHAQQVVSEFLIPQKRFENSLAKTIQNGDSVNVAYAGTDGSDEFYKATVQEVRAVDQSYPDSPWEAVLVCFEDGETSNVSPWEVTMSRNPSSESAVHCWTRLGGFDKTTIDILSRNLKELIETNAENFQNFVLPVPLDQLPDYSAMIPLPMDLQLIMERISSSYYRQLDALLADLKLIRDNCYVYNRDGSQICIQADNMLMECIKMIRTNLKLSTSQKQLSLAFAPHAEDMDIIAEPVSEEKFQKVMIDLLSQLRSEENVRDQSRLDNLEDEVNGRAFLPKRKGKRKSRHTQSIPLGCIGLEESLELYSTFAKKFLDVVKHCTDGKEGWAKHALETVAHEHLGILEWEFPKDEWTSVVARGASDHHNPKESSDRAMGAQTGHHKDETAKQESSGFPESLPSGSSRGESGASSLQGQSKNIGRLSRRVTTRQTREPKAESEESEDWSEEENDDEELEDDQSSGSEYEEEQKASLGKRKARSSRGASQKRSRLVNQRRSSRLR